MAQNNPLNAANGGSPESSSYGQAVKRSNFFAKLNVRFFTAAGVHPATTVPFYPGLFGSVPRGGKVPFPVVPYTPRYMGDLPMSQQPTLRKPYPWE